VGPRSAVLLLIWLAALLFASCSDDNPKPDAPPPGEAGACVGTLPFLATCTMNEECMGSCLCQSFGHTKQCTITCMNDPDCPAPSGGCTNGVCRP